MALTKEQKKKILEDLKEKIAKQKMMIFVDFTGLKVKDLFELRKRLKKADSQLKVVKKTLLNLALRQKKIEIGKEILKGEIASVFGFKKEIIPAKIVYQFSLENPNLKILGGFYEDEFKEAEEMVTLAQLPTKEELLAKLVRSISAPILNFVNVLQGNLRGLVSILSQIKVTQ